MKWANSTDFTDKQVQWIFVVKVLVGIGFALFYQLYYGSREYTDAFRFYDDALIIYRSLHENPSVYFRILFGFEMSSPEVTSVIDQLYNWYKQHHHGVFNDNQTIIRFNALVLILSQGNYHVHTVFINFLSLSGLLALLRGFSYFTIPNKWFSLLVIFFPQTLMWTSGVLKEGLLFFFLGWFFLILTRLLNGSWSKLNYLGLILLLFGLTQVKSYVLFCLIPGLTILVASRFLPSFRKWSVSLLLILVELLTVIGVDMVRGGERAQFIFQKQHDFINMALAQGAGSYFESFVLEPSWGSIIANAPWAFFNTISKPLFWDSNNLIAHLASLENLFLIVVFIIPIIWFKKPKSDQIPFLVLSVSFWVLLWTLAGLVTPVGGALIRYKIPALPFLFALIYILTDWNKLKSFVR